ncbi:sporulation protein YunB [Anaerosinus sp.]|uniref:sporulation protein YunB n=1 Tax=Selenobaculum sp. TaxID=3074374 RepID=UPI0015AF2D7D
MRFIVQERKKKTKKFIWICIGSILILFYLFWVMETHLKPSILAIAEARAIGIATQSINKVIEDKVKNKVESKDLLDVKLDNQGKIVFIQPNTMEFNRLSAEITIDVQKTLQDLSRENIEIPLGQITGSQILASIGPNINVAVIPVGVVKIKTINNFEQAGINQTKHMISLAAETEVKIVVPMISKSSVVNTQVPIAEYVIVGDVPNTYVHL